MKSNRIAQNSQKSFVGKFKSGVIEIEHNNMTANI